MIVLPAPLASSKQTGQDAGAGNLRNWEASRGQPQQRGERAVLDDPVTAAAFVPRRVP